MKPKRIQLRRTKGWRKPANCVVVSRPGKRGNVYHVERTGGKHRWPATFGRWCVWTDANPIGLAAAVEYFDEYGEAVEFAVRQFWRYLRLARKGRALARAAKRELSGKDVACFCRLDRPCHGDVLLEVANR